MNKYSDFIETLKQLYIEKEMDSEHILSLYNDKVITKDEYNYILNNKR